MSIPYRPHRLSLALVLALVLLGPLLALAPPARAADCQVTNGDDFGDGSLRAALARSDCATISFALPGPMPWTIGVSFRLEISRDVTILGPGANNLAIKYVGSPVSYGSVIWVRKGTIVLRDLTLTGGRTQGIWGAGLTTTGELGVTDITMVRVTVTGNVAKDAGGGGIYASNAVLTLTDSLIANNQANGATTDSFGGGGLFLDDHYGNMKATLIRTTVNGNQTTRNSGGGMLIWHRNLAKTVTVEVTDSAISGNTVTTGDYTSQGGGIYNRGGALTLTNSLLSDNQGDNGGGLFDRGTTTLRSSTIAGNRASSGAGFYVNGGDMTLNGSTVSGNSANGYGGGIYNDGKVKLLNSTVSGNTAALGGGIFNIYGQATLTQATLTGNRASYDGGGIYNMGLNGAPASATIGRSIIAGNLKGSTAQDCTSSDNTYAPFLTAGYNLVGSATGCPATGTDTALAVPIAAALDPTLANNGGPTRTHALVAGSPALDRIPIGLCDLITDQRAITRPQGPTCDIGAVEARTFTLTTGTTGGGSGSVGPATGPYLEGTVVSVVATANGGSIFGGWTVDGSPAGTANPLGVTIGTYRTVVATFSPAPPAPSPSPSPSPSAAPPCGARFGDVPGDSAACAAIEGLAARGVINGCDSSVSPPLFCPAEPTLRHQMAALIARAMPGWAAETGLPSFSDNTEDTELMTRVATLQRHNVVRGYQDEICAERGLAPPCYGPLDTVKYGQVLLFIARAMVEKGYWQLQPDDRTIFPDQNGAEGADPAADQQTRDHRMIVTYVHYVGAPPDVADVHAPFLRGGVAAGGWADDSSRAWFARAFWPAIRDR